jgi:cold shock CspA family protein
MVKGTMKWTSRSKEFGLLAPNDGSRDIFVRLSSRSRFGGATSEQDDSARLKDKAGSTATPDPAGVHTLASPVEVRTRYQPGHWAGGYEIAQVVGTGYHVQRPGSGDMLPEIFVPADVRRAGAGR